jgi:tetratricopeptide (TPR) repeat protein
LERQLLSQSGTWALGDAWNPTPDLKEPLGSEGVFFVIHQESGRGSEELKKALDRVRAHGFNRALDDIKTVSLQYPNTANALASEYNVIALYRHLGLDDHVQNMASALIRRAPPEPYFSGANYLLALALSSMGDFARAETVFGEIHTGGALVPPQSELLALGAHISQNLRDSQSGASRLLSAIQNENSARRKVELRMELAKLYFAQKQRGSARRALDDVIRECKRETWEVCRKAHYEIADLEYRNRNWAPALEHYTKAIQIFSDTTDAPWGFYQIGNIHRNQRRFDQAITYYDSLAQKFPRSYWADQARWKRDDTIWQKEYEEVLR